MFEGFNEGQLAYVNFHSLFIVLPYKYSVNSVY